MTIYKNSNLMQYRIKNFGQDFSSRLSKRRIIIRMASWIFLAALCLTASGLAWVFTVTNTSDSGDGSLRWAIGKANSFVGANIIQFNIPDTDPGFDDGVWIIRPASLLPAIMDDSTFVDGFSQTVNQGDRNLYGPEIFIDGSDLTEYSAGLEIITSNNTISGVILSGFKYFGIWIHGSNTQNNRVWGNYIGTDVSGSDTLGNRYGVYISGGAKNNIIGSGEITMRNVISGNRSNGIYISGADSNVVVGNFIGTDRTGSISVANGRNGSNGLCIDNRAKHNVIGGTGENEGNIISGNYRDGIHISDADSNIVIGNLIGVDITGVAALGNGQCGVGDGIDIRFGAKCNRIGGSSPEERNVISCNPSTGMRIHKQGTDKNMVKGNFIGLDATGTAPMGNGLDGIHIYDGACENVIGGTTIIEANIISGNKRNGIYVEKTGTDSNMVCGNFIGTDVTGLISIGNWNDGVCIQRGSLYNQVGPDNIIWYNGRFGVELTDSLVQYITITQNSISENDSGGIKLQSGANLGIEAPLISSDSPLSGTSMPSCTIEVFSDSSDQGCVYEGMTLADGSGEWTWTGTPIGPNITVTATDQDGNTSPFSFPFVATVAHSEELSFPVIWSLSQNYPNPFNPETFIQFSVKEPCRVILKLYNILGREVATLVDEFYQTGLYGVSFDASELSSGIYFYRVEMGSFQAIRKMVVLE